MGRKCDGILRRMEGIGRKGNGWKGDIPRKIWNFWEKSGVSGAIIAEVVE
jgi:hypothetical protein